MHKIYFLLWALAIFLLSDCTLLHSVWICISACCITYLKNSFLQSNPLAADSEGSTRPAATGSSGCAGTASSHTPPLTSCTPGLAVQLPPASGRGLGFVSPQKRPSPPQKTAPAASPRSSLAPAHRPSPRARALSRLARLPSAPGPGRVPQRKPSHRPAGRAPAGLIH